MRQNAHSHFDQLWVPGLHVHLVPCLWWQNRRLCNLTGASRLGRLATSANPGSAGPRRAVSSRPPPVPATPEPCRVLEARAPLPPGLTPATRTRSLGLPGGPPDPTRAPAQGPVGGSEAPVADRSIGASRPRLGPRPGRAGRRSCRRPGSDRVPANRSQDYQVCLAREAALTRAR